MKGRSTVSALRSLTEIAFAMTGTRWSGPRFFGIRARAEMQTEGRRHTPHRHRDRQIVEE
jgi:hypothetical protein